MIRREAYGIVLLVSIWADDCPATSIVAIRSHDTVAIAADSLLTIHNRNGDDTVLPACKIFRSGKIFYTFTGFFRDPARGFDVVSIVEKNLPEDGLFGAATEKAATAVVAGMRGEIQKIRSEDPPLYKKHFEAATGPLLQLLFATSEAGVPVMTVYDIRKSALFPSDGELRYERLSCPGDCGAQGQVAYFLTDTRPIEKYLKKEKLVIRSPEETAAFLVRLVIDAHTPDTAPPVDVLRIDGNGAAWVVRKKECPDLPSAEQ
jgi:hypothetical protein